MRTKKLAISPVEKERQRLEIEIQVREFICRGGRIEILAVTTSYSARAIAQSELLEERIA